MFNHELFKNKISSIRSSMKESFRGELDSKIEANVIDELANIYDSMPERYQEMVNSGSSFPAQPGISDYPNQEKVFRALEDFLERMELDFTQKFVKDFTHGLDKEVEIGKIKISFLDGIRRGLQQARV